MDDEKINVKSAPIDFLRTSDAACSADHNRKAPMPITDNAGNDENSMNKANAI
jgi:hypothetical protein